MPLLITEFGVPSSLGSAHLGPLGRDQGAHTEQEAMRIDAELMRVIRDQGLGGAFVFSWADEWFKRTWNTEESQVAERRQLWHDPLTNEQWFGVLATDAGEVPDGARELAPADGPAGVRAGPRATRRTSTSTSPAATRRRRRRHRARRHAAGWRAARGPDYRVVVDREAGTRAPMSAASWTRSGSTPREDRLPRGPGRPVAPLPPAGEPEPHGRRRSARSPSSADVGELVEGSWDPEDAGLRQPRDLAGRRAPTTPLHLRLPWPMLGLADPSSRTALGTGRPGPLVPSRASGSTCGWTGLDAPGLLWPRWNSIGHTERLVAGAELLGEAFRELAP